MYLLSSSIFDNLAEILDNLAERMDARALRRRCAEARRRHPATLVAIHREHRRLNNFHAQARTSRLLPQSLA